MANEKIGEELKIYSTLYPAVQRQLKGRSPAGGEKFKDEYLKPARQVTNELKGVRAGEARSFRADIADRFGPEIADPNTADLQTRYQRVLNEYNDSLYESERRFIQAVKTKGLENALDMFGTQLGAETDTYTQEQSNLGERERMGAEQAFVARESALDRVLGMDIYNTQISLQKQQQKSDRKKGMFGMLGSLAGLAGLVAAPFTFGTSAAATLGSAAAGASASMLARRF